MENDRFPLKLDGYYRWTTVNGERFETDIIIHTDGSVTERCEHLSVPYKFGFHIPLSEEELGFLHEEKPSKVFIACGYKTMMNLTPGAQELLKSYTYVEKGTMDIINMINEQKPTNFVAIVHSRC